MIVVKEDLSFFLAGNKAPSARRLFMVLGQKARGKRQKATFTLQL